MKPIELLIVAATHLIAFVVTATVIYTQKIGEPSLALVVGAVCGAQAAAVLYHRRTTDRARFWGKASAGVVLAAMAVVTGVASQVLLTWITYPEVVIPIAFVGSFLCPYVMFGPMRKAFGHGRGSSTSSKP